MSYPAPPGYNPAREQQSRTPPVSLPARPPPSAAAAASSGFKPAYNNNHASTSGSGYGAFTAFAPRAVASTTHRTQNPAVSAPAAPTPGYSGAPQSYGQNTYSAPYQQPSSYYQQPQSYGPDAYAAPSINNPFPAPNQAQDGGFGRGRGGRDANYDPEMEAQIAQWQSAYVSTNQADANPRGGQGGYSNRNAGGPSSSGANAGPVGSRGDTSTSTTYAGPAMPSTNAAATGSNSTPTTTTIGPQATVVRSGGGQTWTDSSLLEWDPAHFRLFVGNLAGEVTDESLLKAFSKFPSVQKARVIREKRTTKSRGYGFVSFSDGDEYFRAAREMQGKYIGSHPVLLRRSTTEIRPQTQGGKNGGKNGKNGKGGSGAGGGKNSHGGVQKKSGKTKGGLKVLG